MFHVALTPKVKVKYIVMYFLVASPKFECNMDRQIMYFLVNASPPKLLEILTSNFAGA